MIPLSCTYSSPTTRQAMINSSHKPKLTNLRLAKSFLITYMVPEIGSSQVVHGQVQVKLILERAIDIDQERVVQWAKNIPFVHYWLNVVFLDYSTIIHKIYFFLLIYFIAYYLHVFFFITFHTFPKPPNPIWYMNLYFDIYVFVCSSMFTTLPHFDLFIGVTVDVKQEPEYLWRFFIISFKFGFFPLLDIFFNFDFSNSASFGFIGDLNPL